MNNVISQSKNININYAARIARIEKIEPIEKADKLVLATVCNSKIVVGKDYEVGDLVVYFPVESAISDKYLGHFNLFDSGGAEKNSNYNEYSAALQAGEPTKGMVGYFNKQGRVRAVKLRGCYSIGYVAPVETLEEVYPGAKSMLWTKYLNEPFDTICGERVCWKYIPPTAVRTANNGGSQKEWPRFNRVIDFTFHYDTEMLRDNLEDLQPHSHICVSVKLHGTSIILSNTLVNKKLSRWDRFKKWIGFNISGKEYGLVYSSRKIIKNKYTDKFTDDVWGQVARIVGPYIPKGYTLYGEVVGYNPDSNTFIQKNHDYGCKPGEWKLLIYRITRTTEGETKELWPSEIQEVIEVLRKLLGDRIMNFPILYDGSAGGLFDLWSKYIRDFKDWKMDSREALELWRKDLLDHMANCKEWSMEMREPLCTNKVPREGVVIRVENRPKALKLKTNAHYLMETENLDAGVKDIETEN